MDEFWKQDWFWIVVIGGGSVMLTFVLLKFSTSYMKKKLVPLQNAFGGQINTGLFKGVFLRLNIDGVDTDITLRPGSKNSPPMLIFARYRSLGFRIRIYKENIATRGLDKLGIFKELKIGDPTFDDKYRIRSRDEMQTRNYLMDKNHRHALDSLFDQKFSTFWADDKAIWLAKNNYKKEDLEPTKVQFYLDHFRALWV